MPEENQIQTWFQPESQVNSQIQQDNLAQSQQINQGIVQQNNVGPAEQNLSQSTKPHSSRLTKIVSCIFWLLWITLIWLWIYWIFETQPDRHYSDYTIRDIIMDSWIFILGPLWIWLIILWILSYRTPDVNIYYHPSRLTKILSGIYRFLWIALIRAGLRNFSLVGSEYTSFWHILYVWWAITLCGILYIFLWRLLYNTKNKMHLWFSMLCALVVNIIFARILREFTDYSYWIDGDIFESFWNILVLFTLIYFSILTIRRIIKSRKFNKKWIINPKYLNSAASKKKVWIITTVILLSIVIVDLIYGKLQWSKIPEIDESIFARKEHQTKLSDEEDALIQWDYTFSSEWYKDIRALDSFYLSENSRMDWKQHPEECIIVYSWWESYCGTRIWNRNTLYRFLNRYYPNNKYNEYEEIFTINGEKATILEYLNNNEPEIRAKLKNLDYILSLNYYLPNDEFLSIHDKLYRFQSFSRVSVVLLQYYTYKKDWDMVAFIIQLNYKMIDIRNHIWSNLSYSISIVLEWIIDDAVNSSIQLFPKDLRMKLVKLYIEKTRDKDNAIHEIANWEYIIWNEAKKHKYITNDYWEPSLFHFLSHFPFYSENDTNKLMLHSYELVYNNQYDFDKLFDKVYSSKSLYNGYGLYIFNAISPRIDNIKRLDRSIAHQKALIVNLKSGKHDVWFREEDRKVDPYYHENYLLPNDKG